MCVYVCACVACKLVSLFIEKSHCRLLFNIQTCTCTCVDNYLSIFGHPNFSHCWFVRCSFSSMILSCVVGISDAIFVWCRLFICNIYTLYSMHTYIQILHACIQTIVKCAEPRSKRYEYRLPVAGDGDGDAFHHTRDAILCLNQHTENAHDGMRSKWGERVSQLSICVFVW